MTQYEVDTFIKKTREVIRTLVKDGVSLTQEHIHRICEMFDDFDEDADWKSTIEIYRMAALDELRLLEEQASRKRDGVP